jgi:NADPH-dependent 2,4-dienoyl-CoA reductase/sulfur reductase-like enzyme
VPNTEIQQLLGCQLNNGYVHVNELQETTVKDIFCAGEPTGIAGVESALIEGQIAGLAAIGRAADARKLFAARSKAQRFGRLLDRAFRLRPDLRAIPTASTIVCRCEDVSCSRLQPHTSWRTAKLQTRCGMGPCQGRVCGPATQFLFNWNPESVRPPIFPARVESLAAFSEESNVQHGAVRGGRS